MRASTKLKYMLWAGRRWPTAPRDCPGCGSDATRLIKRKHVVTGLYGCAQCRLMFRVPKGSLLDDERFYDAEYMHESPSDYTHYIDVLRGAEVCPPQSVYDFGSSWGYGSRQLREHGFTVFSYEVGAGRARFARDQLGCYCLPSPRAVPQKVDCFLASHVLEHFADPNALWEIASDVLQPHGVIMLVMPNGEPARERLSGARYHQLWGRVHPLLLSADALQRMAARHGFSGAPSGQLDGDELFFVARRSDAV